MLCLLKAEHALVLEYTFSFQEFSQRYAVATETDLPLLRRQDLKNRQNSIDDLDPFITQKLEMQMQTLFDSSMALYQQMLERGVAKECARMVLPLAVPTRMYMSGSVRSWVHYIELRTANGTQKEHMDLANECKTIFAEQFPEFLLTVAEENWVNGYTQALSDLKYVEGTKNESEELYDIDAQKKKNERH